MNNIVLIGLMGSGKSTVGRLLAKKIGAQFIDTDEVLEYRTGVSVSTIFEIEGELGFRERESKLIEELQVSSCAVIATGGGAVLDPDNREILKKTGLVIYLKAELDTLYDRLKGGKGRPLLEHGDLRKKLKLMLAERQEVYMKSAHVIVETGHVGVDEVIDEMVIEISKLTNFTNIES